MSLHSASKFAACSIFLLGAGGSCAGHHFHHYHPHFTSAEVLPMTSFRPEVIADASGKWVSNGLCFAKEQEAQNYVTGLMIRWTAVRDTRVIPCDEPVTHKLLDGTVIRLEA